MSKVVVYGASDDLVEIEGAISEEFSHYDKGTELLFESESGAVVVTAHYTSQGTWAIGLAPSDESVGLPDWDFQIKTSAEVDYSTALHFNAPDDITVRDVTR